MLFKNTVKASALCSLLMVSGCASIVGDSAYPVSIKATPDAANFTITNRSGAVVHSGVTPSVVTLKSSAGYFKRESYLITVSKEGFSEKTYTLTSSVDGWYWGNILFGGLIGMLIVDPATGAMYKLQEDVLVKLDASTAAASNQILSIASIDSLTEEQKAKLVKLN